MFCTTERAAPVENPFRICIAASSAPTAGAGSEAGAPTAKVVGFKVEIGYYPPLQNVLHKFQRTGMKVGLGFGGAPVTDWRGLITDSQAITVTP